MQTNAQMVGRVVAHPPGYLRAKDCGINQDFGLFDSPDEFYARHGVNVTGVKRWLFQQVVRQQMNGNVARIRNGADTPPSSVLGSGVGAASAGKDHPNSGHAVR